ncbi:MAG: DUF4240 domain-containing protein [Ferruginibacter sp.]
MGLFDKLFGRNNSAGNGSDPVKTDQLLDENIYWQLIHASLKKTDQDEQEEYLVSKIEQLTPVEIVGFRLQTDKFLYDTYTSDMWCAAYLMNGGCSDDGFEYFRCWLISRGKDIFYKAKENPDSLIRALDEEMDEYEFEGFWQVAVTAFENKTGKDLYDFIGDNFKFGEGDYKSIDVTWKEEDPQTMKAICPKLFDRMWK